jgi:hypothetical protein
MLSQKGLNGCRAVSRPAALKLASASAVALHLNRFFRTFGAARQQESVRPKGVGALSPAG